MINSQAGIHFPTPRREVVAHYVCLLEFPYVQGHQHKIGKDLRYVRAAYYLLLIIELMLRLSGVQNKRSCFARPTSAAGYVITEPGCEFLTCNLACG
jgi:hypothetical protein